MKPIEDFGSIESSSQTCAIRSEHFFLSLDSFEEIQFRSADCFFFVFCRNVIVNCLCVLLLYAGSQRILCLFLVAWMIFSSLSLSLSLSHARHRQNLELLLHEERTKHFSFSQIRDPNFRPRTLSRFALFRYRTHTFQSRTWETTFQIQIHAVRSFHQSNQINLKYS